ncbi:hypothetical protein [Algihabitans albus]|uniref:hypothetical protein n=1 Tax=Algihabitans albus TaxID=2164067 RepID=UPI000E5D5C6A|nr:hypothetical protein [Algihabitans albus]
MSIALADNRQAEKAGLRLAAALILLSALALLTLSLRQPQPEMEVALIFAPGTSQDAALIAVAEANGRTVRPGAWSNILVAVFPKELAWNELWEMGALVAVDPLAFGACLISDGADA